MKKFTFVKIIVLSSILFTIPVKAAQTNITLNGEPIKETAIIQNDETLLPMRAVLEKLGATISWNNENKCAEAIKNDEYIRFNTTENKIESGIISDVNGYVPVSIEDNALTVTDGRLYIPFSAVATLTRCLIDDEDGINISIPTDAESWIYYASWSDGGHMYKIDSNGQNRQKLSDNDCYNLSHADGYIYYSIRGDDEDKLYRVKTDGTGEEKIIDKAVLCPVSSYDKDGTIHYITDDNSIYYIATEQDSLFKLNLSTGKDELIAQGVSDAAVFNGDLYISTESSCFSFDFPWYYNDASIIFKQNGNDLFKMAKLDGYGYFTFDDCHFIYKTFGREYILSNEHWIEKEYEDNSDTDYTKDGNYIIIEKYSDENYEIIYETNDIDNYCYRKTGSDDLVGLIPYDFQINNLYREDNIVYVFGYHYNDFRNTEPEEHQYIIINLDNPDDIQKTPVLLQDFKNIISSELEKEIIYMDTNKQIFKINFDSSEKERLFPPSKFLNKQDGTTMYSPLLQKFRYSPEDKEDNYPEGRLYTLWNKYADESYSQITNEYSMFFITVNNQK